jgi:hypothetical protein
MGTPRWYRCWTPLRLSELVLSHVIRVVMVANGGIAATL